MTHWNWRSTAEATDVFTRGITSTLLKKAGEDGIVASKDAKAVQNVFKQIDQNFDLSPRGIRELLGLNRAIYQPTAAYGHFGREPLDNGQFSWEKTDKKDIFIK